MGIIVIVMAAKDYQSNYSNNELDAWCEEAKFQRVKLLDSAGLLDFSQVFDKVSPTHMLIFIQRRTGDPVQYLSTDMYPAKTFLHISRSTKY